MMTANISVESWSQDTTYISPRRPPIASRRQARRTARALIRGTIAAWAALAPLAAGARGQGLQDRHAVQPERPTVATHAGTVAPGWVELETGVELDRLDGAHTLLT